MLAGLDTRNMPATIQLDPLSLIDIANGGYHVKTHITNEPSEYAVLLEVGRFGPWLDITGGYTTAHLEPLLKCLSAYAWGSTISCKALLISYSPPFTGSYRVHFPGGVGDRNCSVLAESNAQELQTPVEPLPAPIAWGRSALVTFGAVAPPLRYVGVPGPSGIIGKGRVLYYRPLAGYYFFARNWEGKSGDPDPADPQPVGQFTVDPVKRGFDCTTYVIMAFQVCQQYSQPPNAFGDGSKVAECLNAVDTGVNGAARATAQAFFEQNTRGDFIMWITGRHCTMVLNGWVYEFSPKNMGHGFRCTEVQQWLAHASQGNVWNIRALPGTQFTPLTGGQGKGGAIGIGQPGGAGGGQGSLPSTGGKPGGQLYTVVSGDSLSLIAGRYYGDVLLWPIIYDANRAVVGPDPNLIQPGQRLTIPKLDGYTKTQLEAIRQRGRQS